ncbi:helix-turn-helix domain-containing protein [Bordetella sp. BOR01]|uniref:helix-turn-helix domain-containing protein n=1 Tax=Bordetella sp. BOR01 TaxID=2854779 RepID=UPI00351CCA88
MGALVRAARLAQGFRIDDMAAFCGVSQDLMSRLENGRPVTSEKLLQVLHRMGLAMLVLPKADIPEANNRLASEENPHG